ncbi:PssD/Cps14F family polysaccharide biosynthesis glycosyltransferase [Pontibacter fetidus]|uniref:Polysaccharide biosynthesis protein n=1 Tax=Pontibacter fetidus TaxID=2700082 RepID=A0A6B2H331_9BACT|nr:PssD/Cps14F family polysaccharide biosynthesis glycosyltransferase [Pontibacter fetidus]NDK57515.1 polysaccharide biosynthesis protein [Pontibacter fetidus]
MKVCITFSGGGHYVEAMNACSKLLENPEIKYFFVTYKSEHTKKSLNKCNVRYVVHPKHSFLIKRLILFLGNFISSFHVFVREMPDVVISTGADVTVGMMLIAKIFRKKVVFIETGASVNGSSLTGRIAYRFSDLFIVQWQGQLSIYPKAIFGGPLL